MAETVRKCKLNRSPAKVETSSVAEFIREQAKQTHPMLIWVDPDPTAVDLNNATGRRIDSLPLFREIPGWIDEVPLVEARLFWQNAALHVIADKNGGCRWASIEEIEGDEYIRNEIEVMTLRDLSRFALTKMPAIDNLRAIEYRQRGKLIAWRLVIGNNGGGNA